MTEALRLEADLIEKPGRAFPAFALAAEMAGDWQAECVRPACDHHRQLALQGRGIQAALARDHGLAAATRVLEAQYVKDPLGAVHQVGTQRRQLRPQPAGRTSSGSAWQAEQG